MIEHRFEIQARLESGMSERRVDGSALQLVTVCLCDEGGGRGERRGRRAAGKAAGGQLPASRRGAGAGVLPVGAGGAGRAAVGGAG
jgi:hypothetical protein